MATSGKLLLNRKPGPMGFSLKIDTEQRLVTTSVWDVVDKESILAFRRELHADTRFNPDFNQLIEYQPNTKLALSSQDLQELKLSDPFSPVSRRAAVVHSDVLFGYARMYATLLESTGQTQLRVFRNMEEAALWIEGEQELEKPVVSGWWLVVRRVKSKDSKFQGFKVSRLKSKNKCKMEFMYSLQCSGPDCQYIR